MRYRFESFVLDTDRRELRRGDVPVDTTRQVFDLLKYLIANHHRVVGKEDLLAAIWGGRIVSESALTTRLHAARRAISDTGEAQRLIRTLSGEGYRFVGEVRAEVQGPAPDLPHTKHRGDLSPESEPPTLAILPFFIMDDVLKPVTRWRTIEQDLRVQLAARRWLHILVADAEAPQCTADGLDQARRCGARYVLTGRVRSFERGARVTIDLIEVASRLQLWTVHQNPPPCATDNSDLVRRTALAVSAALRRREQQRAACKERGQLTAWEAYQLGMLHMSRCDPLENRLARVLFQRSVENGPDYAPGYSALAWSYMMSASIFSEMPIAEGCILGDSLARTALNIDEDEIDAHARLALSDLLKGDLDEALKGSEQVLARVPENADALGVKGAALVYSNRREEGRQALNSYLSFSDRDPARPIRLSQIATSYYLDENYLEAAAVAKRVIRRYPRHPTSYRWLAASLGQLGKLEEAGAAFAELQQLSPASFEMYVRNRPTYCSVEHAPMLSGLRKAGLKV